MDPLIASSSIVMVTLKKKIKGVEIRKEICLHIIILGSRLVVHICCVEQMARQRQLALLQLVFKTQLFLVAFELK